MKEAIKSGKTALGIEFGSTRIKAVLVDENNNPIAMGSHKWENQYVDGIWTYSLDMIWNGLQDCYANLAKDVKEKYDVVIEKVGAIGFSAMMHGYMAFDKNDELLVPFRTWRNTITEQAADKLTEVFDFNIPQRWSIAHLYQAILNKEAHVKDVTFFTTLAGYIHWKLSGKKVLGVGEASGMFPIDSSVRQFDKKMIGQFDELIAGEGFSWKLEDILPGVLTAGEEAGVLTDEGAKLLDVSGNLKGGIPMCPPEGDAGTGMVATNSVTVHTGNVSAGTSIFGMIVMDKKLKKVHRSIDLVTTPIGDAVAMVHCNNCTSDINGWVGLFSEFAESCGHPLDDGDLFRVLFNKADEGDADCGGLLSYNYISGEPVSGFEEGKPLFARATNSKFNLANFMRTHIYSAFAVLKMGFDELIQDEGVSVDTILGHGGIFIVPGVAQKILAAALNVPVTVMKTAGEGGAWGMAVLASYMINKKDGEALDVYLKDSVFNGQEGITVQPEAKNVEGFNKFIEGYEKGFAIERAAVDSINE